MLIRRVTVEMTQTLMTKAHPKIRQLTSGQYHHVT